MRHVLLRLLSRSLRPLPAVLLALTASVVLADTDTLEEQLAQARAEAVRGELRAAREGYRRLLDRFAAIAEPEAAELAAAAAAAAGLGAVDPQQFKIAVRLYDRAIAAAPERVDYQVALGNLLLDKYNSAEALELFRQALEREPEHPRALLGLARSQHFDFSPEALQTVRRALQIEPDFSAARAFLARLYIELEQYDAAETEARAAIAADPDSLEARALLAATHYLSGDEDGFAAVERELLARNPRYADLYNVLAELAARTRLYHEAVAFAERAVTLDPQSWRGHGLLGMNRLRVGQIDAGRQSLELAFRGDPYNVWIKNTLDLADTFGDYELIENSRFRLFVHRGEAELLAPYILELADRAYQVFAEKYRYRAETPVRIEFYPRHADFSVRTAGLAGIGILGVSFGPVVAMDSPSGRPVGSFNWGSTLWHELAHTFHLGLSRHRVPRWFSEGLAVFEERQAHPGWGGDVSVDFLLAYRDDKLLPVSELNNGFVRPSYPQQIVHSYYQASLVFDFLDQRWGFDTIRDMLAGFADGGDSSDLIERATGLDAAGFDRAFDGYLRERFAGPLAALAELDGEPPQDPQALTELAEEHPGHFGLQQRAAQALFAAERFGRAEVFARRARDLFPEYAGGDGPYWLLAQIYDRRGELELAAEQLTRMTDVNAEHYDAHIRLAELRQQLGDPEGAAEMLRRALYIYPFSPQRQQQLAELSEELNDCAQSVAARRAVLALDPVDRAEAYFRLARSYFAAGRRDEARRTVLQALEIAPNFDQALELLLELRAAGS